MQQNLWSFSQISGAERFKSVPDNLNSCHPPLEKKRRVWEVLRISDIKDIKYIKISKSDIKDIKRI